MNKVFIEKKKWKRNVCIEIIDLYKHTLSINLASIIVVSIPQLDSDFSFANKNLKEGLKPVTSYKKLKL